MADRHRTVQAEVQAQFWTGSNWDDIYDLLGAYSNKRVKGYGDGVLLVWDGRSEWLRLPPGTYLAQTAALELFVVPAALFREFFEPAPAEQKEEWDD